MTWITWCVSRAARSMAGGKGEAVQMACCFHAIASGSFGQAQDLVHQDLQGKGFGARMEMDSRLRSRGSPTSTFAHWHPGRLQPAAWLPGAVAGMLDRGHLSVQRRHAADRCRRGERRCRSSCVEGGGREVGSGWLSPGKCVRGCKLPRNEPRSGSDLASGEASVQW